MKYKNAKDILPPEVMELLQDYVQGAYLYVPRREHDLDRKQAPTNYKVELEKRNRHIYVKYLEGWGSRRIAAVYHLSESSVRRIILKQRQEFKEQIVMIKNIVELWGLEPKEVKQIYHSAWDIDGGYVLKIYGKQAELERNLQVLKVLYGMGVPVAEVISLANGDEYANEGGNFYLLTRKLPGNNISNIRTDRALAHKMGGIIGKLHLAFQKCEDEVEFRNNSLLDEINGWVKDKLMMDQWSLIGEGEFLRAAEQLEAVYDQLPKQLIHRDVHFGNFLFDEGEFSGYIDFDLSQRNIRIFDICYFLLGLLVEDEGNNIDKRGWQEIVAAVLAGYESQIQLTKTEKKAIPCVMENIELLFVSYFVGLDDLHCAKDAARIFRLVKAQENELLL